MFQNKEQTNNIASGTMCLTLTPITTSPGSLQQLLEKNLAKLKERKKQGLQVVT